MHSFLVGLMNKKNLRDHISIKEVIRAIYAVVLDYLTLFKEWITDYGKVILPIVLLALVSATVFISFNARARVEAAAQEALTVLEETKAEVQQVQEILFEVDAYPELQYLMMLYYEALEMGDVDALIDIQSSVTNTEIIRLQKMSKYIDRYENIHVYSKPGPYVETFIAYVTSDVYLKDREEATPGLQAFYICIDEFGNYYINTGELSKEEASYIQEIADQADVIDLKNTVNVNYNSVMEDNEELSNYWAKVSVEIDLAVGEQLALESVLIAQLEDSEKEADEDVAEEDEPVATITKVKTTDYVNVRKSASATADRLGSVNAGETFNLLENMLNGWTKIDFNGTEGYIKSEYLIMLEDISVYNTVGVVKAISLLNVRTEPDASSAKIGALAQGASADLVEILDEWCKIKFNGQIGYVSKAYVEY